MKSFITALILLSLLICAVTVNAIYVVKVCDEITLRADKLSAEGYSEQEVSSLLSFWKKHEKLLGVGIDFDELERMNDLMQLLPVLKEETSSDEFVRACGLISSLSKEFASYERASLESLF